MQPFINSSNVSEFNVGCTLGIQTQCSKETVSASCSNTRSDRSPLRNDRIALSKNSRAKSFQQSSLKLAQLRWSALATACISDSGQHRATQWT